MLDNSEQGRSSVEPASSRPELCLCRKGVRVLREWDHESLSIVRTILARTWPATRDAGLEKHRSKESRTKIRNGRLFEYV